MPNDNQNENQEPVVLKGEVRRVVTIPETTTGPLDWVPQLFGQVVDWFSSFQPSSKRRCLISEYTSQLVVTVTSSCGVSLEGATVEINGPSQIEQTGKTNSEGTVRFQHLKVGSYKVSASAKYYQAKQTTTTVNENVANATQLELKLIQKLSELDLTLLFFQNNENDGKYVEASDFHFLVGQQREIKVKFKTEPPKGLTFKWQREAEAIDKDTTEVSNQSGSVTPTSVEGGQSECSFIPRVTEAQRPVTGSRQANSPISYRLTVTVFCNRSVATEFVTKTVTIKQDCRDIIRQEYLDFLMFRSGFNIPIPTRTEIVSPISGSPFNSNNNYAGCENGRGLVVNRGMIGLYNNILARYQQYCGNACTIHIESSWRCPRRNTAVGGAVNSNHQKGTAMDLQPQPGNMSNFIKLYRAASVYANAEVILEHGTTFRLPKNHPLPQPSKADPDLDGDGFPDSQLNTLVSVTWWNSTTKTYQTDTHTYEYAFSHASHVHAAVK